MLDKIHDYGQVYQLGHREVRPLFTGEVLIEEKIDGSSFGFGLTSNTDGQILMRSKGAQIFVNNEGKGTQKMFQHAVDTVLSLREKLIPGYQYYGEYLQSPKHNVLKYNRIPEKHIIIFDIAMDEYQNFLSYEDKKIEANRLGLEIVPLVFQGVIEEPSALFKLLERESILGGPKIEGIVIKNYSQFDCAKKFLKAKFVSEAFKEVHGTEFRAANPSKGEFITTLTQSLTTEARWLKALQHLKEAGTLTNTPKDIGNLIIEVQNDIGKEEEENIKSKLWDYYKRQILSGTIKGLPEWYKKKLAVESFEEQTT